MTGIDSIGVFIVPWWFRWYLFAFSSRARVPVHRTHFSRRAVEYDSIVVNNFNHTDPRFGRVNVDAGGPPLPFSKQRRRGCFTVVCLIPATAESPLPISNLNKGVCCYVCTCILLLLPILPIVVVRFPDGGCAPGERKGSGTAIRPWFRVPFRARPAVHHVSYRTPGPAVPLWGCEFATGFRFGRAGFSSFGEEKPADPSTPHISLLWSRFRVPTPVALVCFIHSQCKYHNR
jgi:hypothetical protein